MKMKSEYVKSHNLWKKLDSSQKYYIINKYIDEIKIDIDKKYNVSINDIIFNKNEIEWDEELGWFKEKEQDYDRDFYDDYEISY